MQQRLTSRLVGVTHRKPLPAAPTQSAAAGELEGAQGSFAHLQGP